MLGPCLGPQGTCIPGCRLGKLGHMPVIRRCHPCTCVNMQARQLSRAGGTTVVVQYNLVCDSLPSREAAGKAGPRHP